jgi:cytochrome c biogenesis protein CcmG/thiol:disulfide interchange protein DsbE
MRRFILPGSVVAAAIALLALLTFGVAHQGSNTSLDSAVQRGVRPVTPGADIALPILGTSGTQRLSSLRGKVVVLNVFASWCDPCKTEAPILEREQHRLAHSSGTVLGVTYLDNSSDSAQFVRREHITYPVVRDVSGTFTRALGVDGVPETFIIDRQGRVAALRRYQLDGRWLQRTLPRVLAEHS